MKLILLLLLNLYEIHLTNFRITKVIDDDQMNEFVQFYLSLIFSIENDVGIK